VPAKPNTRTSPRPKPRLKAHDRRSQILAAALEVVAEHGFHGTPTRELARRAGVSEALVFRHFPTKEDLIRAILADVGFEERIQFMESHLVHMPPREALQSIAEHLLTNLRERPDLFRVVFFGILETPHLAREFYQKFLSRLLALETRLFERAFAERADGLPAARVNAGVVARSFHGSLMFYNLAGAIVRVEPLPPDPRATAEAIVNIYLPEVEK
jgi:AcrR family transcriptional regulator